MCLVVMASLGACNTTADTDEPEMADMPTNVAVSAFKLAADEDVLVGLDSVFFSIDLNQRVIYNADSLPKGTKIDKLVATITYGSDVTTADVIMTDAAGVSDTINYRTHSTDSIDFTRDVKLHLVAGSGLSEATYTIKVNVHQMVPDTLSWGDAAVCELPSRLPSPREQRTVKFNDKAYCLMLESDGTYTLASNGDPATLAWDKTIVSPAFTPAVRSFSATSDALYILTSAGELMTSADGESWSSTGQTWNRVLGAYGSSLLGLTLTDGAYSFACYPASASFSPSRVPADFPVSGSTPLCAFASKWAEMPVVITTGGVASDGALVSATWGYDGVSWAKISEEPAPALVDAAMVAYSMFRQPQAGHQTTKEYNVWLLMGGRKDDGTLNEEIYASLDAGIHWQIFSAANALPAAIPPTVQCDLLTLPRDMEASLTDAWKTTRVAYTVDGYDISWVCPHVYMFGGRKADGSLNDQVWKAVLQRLLFTPII